MARLMLTPQPLQQPTFDRNRHSCLARWHDDVQQRGQEELWYEFGPAPRQAGNVAEDAEPYLLAYLFDAMEVGADIHVAGRVSAMLLENLEEYQQAWQVFQPKRYCPVRITVDEVFNRLPAADEGTAIAAFSGGLDSSYTLWSHYSRERGYQNRRIVQTFFVHGFDIPLTMPEEYNKAYSSAKSAIDGLAIPFVTLRTNFRRIMRSNWEHHHAAALVSAAHCMKALSASFLLPGSYGYSYLNYGSNPATDALLSSASLRVIHDGAAIPMPEKSRSVSTWEAGYRNLRVCFEGGKGENCGHCRKCVHRKLSFLAVGVAPPPSIGRITIRDLATLRKTSPAGIAWLRDARRAMADNGVKPPWYPLFLFYSKLAQWRIVFRHLRQKPDF